MATVPPSLAGHCAEEEAFAGLRSGGQAAGFSVGAAQPGGDAEAEIDLAALLAGESHGADDKEGLVALEAVDEAHDLRVFAADAGFHGDLSEVGTGLALRVLDAGEANAGGHFEIADARGDGGVVGRNALVEEGAHLRAGFVDALVEAAQGGGLQVERLELDLLAGEGVSGAGVDGGPVEAEADGQGR